MVVDDNGQTAAAAPIMVNPADEPGTIPDDPVVPPDDPVQPPADTTVPQIHSFTVVPEAGASAAIINYSVSASENADLQEIQVHRAPDVSGVPGTWKHLLNNSVDVIAANISSYTGGTRDGVSDPGYFWYKIVVVDKAGKTTAADPIKVNPADEPGAPPDDPYVPPDDPYVPPDDPYVPGDVAPVSQLHPSANKRYLVESDGTPVFLMGEAAWTMPENATRADVDVYLNDRKSRGFNYVQIAAARDLDGEPTSFTTTRTMNPENMNGHRPFQWNADGKADVTKPIVAAGGTPTAPNDYWDHLEYIIQKAESMNMYVGILPTWSKYYINTTVTTMQLFTKDSAKIYGRFLGDRYKAYPHIIWILGGDGDISNVNTVQSKIVYRAMAEGLVQGMTGQPAIWNVASPLWDQVLIIIHDRYPSHVNFNDDAWLKLNLMRGSETAGGLYERTLDSYYNSPTRPVLLGEAYYEGYVGNDSYHGPLEMRQQAYHSVLGGGLGGYAYGLAMSEVQAQDQIFKFQDGWQGRLDTAEGCNDMRHLVNLINNMGIRWWRLVPDQNIVTDGAGEGNAFKAAARTDDGAQILVYFPNVSYAKIDLRKITSHSRVEATWYDTRTGATRAGGVLANTQTFSFMPPIDWVDSVLILKGTTAALQDPPSTTMREFKTVNGEVVLPAENYSFTGGSGGVWGVWTPQQILSGYLGSSYMQSSLERPEDRSHLDFNTESANLNYVIDFKETGTYYVHLRTYADDHDENGFFATIDGAEVNYGGVNPETGLTAYFIYVRKSSIWRWWTDGGGTESHGLPVSFQITTPGKHTFTLYRRDTGSKVDHIWLTKNNSALEAAPTTAPGVFEVK